MAGVRRNRHMGRHNGARSRAESEDAVCARKASEQGACGSVQPVGGAVARVEGCAAASDKICVEMEAQADGVSIRHMALEGM